RPRDRAGRGGVTGAPQAEPSEAPPSEVFLGYCRKLLPVAPEWLGDPRVSAIASFSDCVAERPEGWIDRWDFNAAGLYDTIEAADAAVGNLDSERYRLFAFTMT